MARIQVLNGTPPDAEAAPENEVSSGTEAQKPASGVTIPEENTEKKVNKGGRPRIPIHKKSTPAPPHRNYDTEAPRGRQPSDFFRYWSSLDPVFQQRLMAYVYRTWPVIQYEVPTKSGVRLSRQQAKVSGEDPIPSIEDLRHRFGSGNYYIHLNDASNANKTIASCTITGIRDMEDHPPIIPNLEWLDMDDPANQSYIAGLRMKGVKFPGDEPEEDEDMSAGINTLAQTVKELASRPQQIQQPAQGQGRSAAEEAAGMKAVIEVMTDASKKSSAMLSEAITKTNEIATKGSDPSAVVGLVREIIALTGGGSKESSLDLAALMSPVVESLKTSREEAAALRLQIAELQKAQMDTLKEMLKERGNQSAQPPKSLSDSLKELSDVKDSMKELLGIEDKDESEPIVKSHDRDPVWVRLLLAGVNMLPGALNQAVALSYNLSLAGKGAAPGSGAVPIHPSQLPSPAPNPALAGLPGAEPAEDNTAVLNMLTQIRNPLLRSVANNVPGGEFAELLTEWTGDPLIHAQLKDQGKDKLLEMLSLDPHIKQVMEAVPARFDRFVSEFLKWDPNPTYDAESSEPDDAADTDADAGTAPGKGGV